LLIWLCISLSLGCQAPPTQKKKQTNKEKLKKKKKKEEEEEEEKKISVICWKKLMIALYLGIFVFASKGKGITLLCSYINNLHDRDNKTKLVTRPYHEVQLIYPMPYVVFS
jgi:flagellar biosynthesis component FlhA